MIDDFLQDLFSGPSSFSDRFTGAPAAPTFGDRFDASKGPAFGPIGKSLGGPMPGPISSMLQAPEPVPLPVPRPGGIADMLGGGQGGGMPPMPPMPAPPKIGPLLARPPAPPDDDVLPPGAMPASGPMPSEMNGQAPQPGGMGGGGLGQTIMSILGSKRFQSALAGGMAHGNPAFGGGAFMKGMSGGLKGGLASDKEDDDADTAAEDKDLKQANFERVQGDRELTSTAQRDRYGAVTKALNEGRPASGRGGVAGTGATERIVDALRRENPNLSYADALTMSKRPPRTADEKIQRERLALSAAKSDPDYVVDPKTTLDKWRKDYKVDEAPGPQSAARPAPERPDLMSPGNGNKPLDLKVPPKPSTVPNGSSYSPSRQMWRSPDGKIFDAEGVEVDG